MTTRSHSPYTPPRLVAARLVCTALLGSGCGTGLPAPMLATGPPSLAFVDEHLMPLIDGGQGLVIHGPQGGYHIVVSLVAHGIWPGTLGIPGSADDPVTTLRAFRADGSELTLAADQVDVLHLAYQPGDGGSVTLTSRQLRLDISAPSQIANARIKLHADARDRDGRDPADEKYVIAIPPSN